MYARLTINTSPLHPISVLNGWPEMLKCIEYVPLRIDSFWLSIYQNLVDLATESRSQRSNKTSATTMLSLKRIATIDHRQNIGILFCCLMLIDTMFTEMIRQFLLTLSNCHSLQRFRYMMMNGNQSQIRLLISTRPQTDDLTKPGRMTCCQRVFASLDQYWPIDHRYGDPALPWSVLGTGRYRTASFCDWTVCHYNNDCNRIENVARRLLTTTSDPTKRKKCASQMLHRFAGVVLKWRRWWPKPENGTARNNIGSASAEHWQETRKSHCGREDNDASGEINMFAVQHYWTSGKPSSRLKSNANDDSDARTGCECKGKSFSAYAEVVIVSNLHVNW